MGWLDWYALYNKSSWLISRTLLGNKKGLTFVRMFFLIIFLKQTADWNPFFEFQSPAFCKKRIQKTSIPTNVKPFLFCEGFKNTEWAFRYWEKSKQTSCNLPLVAVHHFCLTKGFQKTPYYSAIYRSKRYLTVFYITQIVPSFVVL